MNAQGDREGEGTTRRGRKQQQGGKGGREGGRGATSSDVFSATQAGLYISTSPELFPHSQQPDLRSPGPHTQGKTLPLVVLRLLVFESQRCLVLSDCDKQQVCTFLHGHLCPRVSQQINFSVSVPWESRGRAVKRAPPYPPGKRLRQVGQSALNCSTGTVKASSKARRSLS